METASPAELPDANAIADAVLEAFDKLPPKCKPRPRSPGSREWIPLAGIVVARDGKLDCVSLGTGMKCLPSTKLPLSPGTILHDWHAEVLALRAFNRFLLDECLALLKPPHTPSQYLTYTAPSTPADQQHDDPAACTNEAPFPPFRIRDGITLYMYCTEAPCGDASMELVMDAQDDATPWTSAVPLITSTSTSQGPASLPPSSTDEPIAAEPVAALRGRSHFSHLGAVRLKPSRPDAPPTHSKSCTDKLALKQCTSLLSSLTSLLIHPEHAYLTTLVLPSSQYVPRACARAFSRTGRMSAIPDTVLSQWRAGYAFHPFAVRPTDREFRYSRRSVGVGETGVPCNLSAVWTPHATQTLIGGVLQGRKQTDVRGASMVSRRASWKAVAEIAALVGVPALVEVLRAETYREVKESGALAARRRTKEDVRAALKGWVRNEAFD